MDFVAYSFCQLLGAFVGSVLMWLAFLPHFTTVPEPPPDDEEETLLRSRDYVASPVLNIASYDTRREDDVIRSVKVTNPSQVTLAIMIFQTAHQGLPSWGLQFCFVNQAVGPHSCGLCIWRALRMRLSMLHTKAEASLSAPLNAHSSLEKTATCHAVYISQKELHAEWGADTVLGLCPAERQVLPAAKQAQGG